MRQTDSLSFVVNYFNEGFSFFNPKLFNLKNVEGRAVCEFPIIYYLTAIMYNIFGEKEFLLKLINLLIVSTGVFLMFRFIRKILNSFIYSILLSLLLFSSTVFIYYTVNFLPDAGALGFALIGWYFFFNNYFKKNKIQLILAFIFFTLSGLIKVTYFINPLTIVILALIELIIVKKYDKISIDDIKKYILLGLISFCIVTSWNLYVIYYNKLYHSVSFNTKAFPIWNMPKSEISVIWGYIYNYWYSKYFYFSSFHLIFIAFIFQIIFIRKSDRILSLITIILFFGSLSFLMLFYSQFKDHDYYFLTFLPSIIFILLNAFNTLKNIFPKIYNNFIPKLVVLIILVSGINYSKEKLDQRYENGNDNFSRIGFLLKDIKPQLEILKIPPASKFIVIPDLTQNGGLYFLNRKGWNIEGTSENSLNMIPQFIKEGADYILVCSKEKHLIDFVNQFGEKVYDNNEISIFKEHLYKH
ncbi:MAG: hypothetical protein HGB12_17135 [Bacteroidetes bacterium]|nr:hypothetical protein [Bacteroidota bacterium]